MSGMVNQVTSPLGIKLFSGGPYSDAGKSDQMQTDLDKYMAQIGPIIAQIAQAAGVNNPMAANPGGPPPEQDPYGLSPLQQAGVNRQASEDTTSKDAILAKVKANLTARGMGDSSTMTAAEAYLDQQLSSQIGGEKIQAGQNAYQNRNQALQQIAQLLSGGYQAQTQVTASQKQTAESSHANAMQQLGSLLALGMYGGGVGPFGRSNQPAAVPAAGNPIYGDLIPAGTESSVGRSTRIPNIYGV